MPDESPVTGEPPPEFSLATSTMLFELRVIGMLARMFQMRRQTPTGEQLAMLLQHSPIGLRDIAVIAYELEFDVGMMSAPLDPESEA